MRKLISIASAIAFGAGANAATLVNGSFEDGPDADAGPGFVTLNTGDSSITGWFVDVGSIDYIGNYWTAQEGSRSVDLAGNSLGTLRQSLTDTIAGQTYEVSFWVSKNPDLGGNPARTGTFSAGGQNFAFAYATPNDRVNMNWERVSFLFTATGALTDLSFAADSSAGCCFGPAIDNVAITAVPEPASWAMMIAGFGLAGAVARRRALVRVAA